MGAPEAMNYPPKESGWMVWDPADADAALARFQRLTGILPEGPPMTSDEINALPERVRRYIHDLEARADPAGDVAALAAARENLAAMTELRALAWDEGYEAGYADGHLDSPTAVNPYRKGTP
jgi:hypothetical protein